MKRLALASVLLTTLSLANACATDPVIPDWIAYYAHAFGLDPNLLKAVVITESNFCMDALGEPTPYGRAMGLMQLMPAIAQGCGIDPWNPIANLWCGARKLRLDYDYFQDWELAIAAYFAGRGAIAEHGGIPPGYVKTHAYVEKVLTTYGHLAAGR